MASIVDSIRSVQTERFTLLKLGAFSFVVFLIYKLYMPGQGMSLYNIMVVMALSFIYSGFTSIIINNRINQRIETLPTLNVNKFIQTALNSMVILVPFVVIGVMVVDFVLGLFSFEGMPQQIVIWLIRVCVSCSFITALINYSEKFKLAEAFNVSKLLSSLVDVLAYTILGLVAMTIVSVIFAGPVLFLVYKYMEIGPIFEYLTILLFTANMAIMADFWGQLHYDISSRDNYY